PVSPPETHPMRRRTLLHRYVSAYVYYNYQTTRHGGQQHRRGSAPWQNRHSRSPPSTSAAAPVSGASSTVARRASRSTRRYASTRKPSRTPPDWSGTRSSSSPNTGWIAPPSTPRISWRSYGQ